MSAYDATNIHARAMLVNLSISQWSARKIDKRAAAQVATTNKVESRNGSYYKSLVEGGSLEEIKKLVTQVRAAHYRRTLPWSDAGPRVLANLGYMEYVQEMGDFGAKFDTLVGAFLKEYPLLKQEAKRLLGDLFDEADYPDLQTVADKFSFKTSVTPLPMGDDFRCDLGSDEVDRIRAEITATTTAAVEQAVVNAYERISDVVDSFIDRLAGTETVFRDSLVHNAKDLVDILPALNITNDPKLAELTDRLRTKLCAHEPDALRHNHSARKAVHDEAVSMRKDLMDFFGGTL
jgi:hypothetical protein